MNELSVRVHGLPRELFDKIQHLTLASDVSEKHTLDLTYKPASILQVDKASRLDGARSYYGGPGAAFASKDVRVLVLWLRSLPQGHRDMVREVRLLHNRLTDTNLPDIGLSVNSSAKSKLNDLKRQLRRSDVKMNNFDDVIVAQVYVGQPSDSDEIVKTSRPPVWGGALLFMARRPF